jgi:predicted Zn-dependent protease
VNWEWEVNVIDNPLIENVGVLPGGKIVFYTGFFIKEPPLPPLTDDEIAVLMGHEIAHALREHARERGSHELLKVLVVGLSSCLVGLRTGLSTTALKDTGNLIADLGFTRPYSRLHETEADEIGIELAARAGYDPRAAIQFWQTMSIHRSDDQRPQWLSTHPSHATRLKDLESYSIRLLPLYEQAKIKQLEETKPTQQLEETKPTQTRQKPGKGSPSRRPKK